MALKPNMEREGKMERNSEDRTKHRTMTAGIMLGSEKAPEGFLREKVVFENDMETSEDVKQGDWLSPGTECNKVPGIGKTA